MEMEALEWRAGTHGRGAVGQGGRTSDKDERRTRHPPTTLATSLPARFLLLSTMYRRYGWYLTHGLISILLFVSCFSFFNPPPHNTVQFSLVVRAGLRLVGFAPTVHLARCLRVRPLQT